MENMKGFINPQNVSAPFHLIYTDKQGGNGTALQDFYKVKHFSTEGLQ